MNSELGRIADALERIATALEKLTSEEKAPFSKTNQNNKNAQIPQIIAPSTPTKPANLPKNKPVNPTIPKTKLPNNNKTPKLPTSTEIGVLHKYLEKQGITVQKPKKKVTPEKMAYQVKLEELALFLGQNFATCKDLYRLLKVNMLAPRKPFSYSLIGASAEQNKLIRQFCQLLKDADFLEEFNYRGKPEFDIQLKASGKEQKFLSGAWLEYYVKFELDRIVKPYAAKTGQPYEALPNLQIIFKDKTKAELDLFFALGESIFCLEAKTQPVLANLKTWLNRVKPMGLENKAIMIVTLDKSEKECRKLGQELGNITIARLDNLEPTIHSLLGIQK